MQGVRTGVGVMAELPIDRWLNLKNVPAFLRVITPVEHVWWRPLETVALVVVATAIFGVLGTFVASLINFELIRVLMLHQLPAWPDDAIQAVKSNLTHCGDCLMGGVTDGILVGIVSGACMVAILICVKLINHRPMHSFITTAPKFRWRLFLVGLGAFTLLLGGAEIIPETLHGWHDRPVFWKAGETVPIRVAYMLAMLSALPVAAAFEEVMCRGWLLQTTAAFTRNLVAILLANSVIFALLHIDNDIGHNISRASLGMALSYGALRLGGLELGIGVHAANNLVILLLAQTLRQAEKSSPSTLGGILVNLAISAALVGLVELVARWEPLRRWTHAEDEAPGLEPVLAAS
jgi:membrane protease YdiL (CAAX protease family)